MKNSIRNVGLHLLSSSSQELIRREMETPVRVGLDTSLRAKVTDFCGMACVFCHNEGTPVNERQSANGRVSIFENINGVGFMPGIMKPDSAFEVALRQVSSVIAVNEIHWTGGEPTLHPDLPALTRIARDMGFAVKMTSNGESAGRLLGDLTDAGLTGINFSIFGTVPSELAQVQADRFSIESLASIKLSQLDRSIRVAIDLGISTKANIVMRDSSDSQRVRRLLKTYSPLGVVVRILPDLSNEAVSRASIYNLLAELKAEPKIVRVEAGSSNARTDYELPDGTELGFKYTRESRLPTACNTCEFNNVIDCKEGFYGIRLYIDDMDKYHVGLCLQRMDLTVSLSDFVSGSLPKDIQEFRHNDFEYLLKQYSSTLVA